MCDSATDPANVDAATRSTVSRFGIAPRDSQNAVEAAVVRTVFGREVSGLGIVDSVAEAGTTLGDPDGRPALSVIVNEVSVS